jgi:hypothetical protein
MIPVPFFIRMPFVFSTLAGITDTGTFHISTQGFA